MARAPYSLYEDKQILDFVINRGNAPYVMGNSIWMQMEEENLCPNRPWQSLKNRFRRYILPDLNRPEFNLDEDQIRYLKSSIENPQYNKKVSRTPCSNHDVGTADGASTSTSTTHSKPVNKDGKKTTSTSPLSKDFYSLDMDSSSGSETE